MKKEDWFESWFDTPYYHVLYQHRDENEAQYFIDQLFDFLQIPPSSNLLDLACGRGRHAKYMNEKGYQVTGLDLSKKNIEFACQFESDSLHFVQGDMRVNDEKRTFDYIFNLFTSFGYFDDDSEHLQAVKCISESLESNGLFIIDFMNTHKVAKGLVPEEVKEIDGVSFHIERKVEDGYIVKSISFEADGKQHAYTEKVAALTYEDFKAYFSHCNLMVEHQFGDFDLNPFDPLNSDRLILICRKK